MISTNDVNTSGRRMGVGVHMNCTFDHLELKQPKEKKLVEFWFKNQKGEEQKQTIWYPDEEPQVREGESKEEAKEREMNRFLLSIKDIETAIGAESASGKDLDTFIKNVEKNFNAATGRCNVLVHYDRDYQYSEFPRRNWIEPHVEGQGHAFNLHDEYLRMSKPAAPGSSNPVTDGQADDDLPF